MPGRIIGISKDANGINHYKNVNNIHLLIKRFHIYVHKVVSNKKQNTNSSSFSINLNFSIKFKENPKIQLIILFKVTLTEA